MHDKYAYEAVQMALHDRDSSKINGIWYCRTYQLLLDSLSAIKYAKVRPIRNEEGIAIDFEVEGDFPKYGNDDDRVDEYSSSI